MSAPGSALPRRKFPWLAYWIAFAVIFVVSWGPMGAAYYAEHLAKTNSCPMTDGSIGECLDAAGQNIGPFIDQLMMLAWMMILTLPLGFILGLIWFIALVVHRILWGRGQKAVTA